MKCTFLFLVLFFTSIYSSVYCQEQIPDEVNEHEKIRHHWINLFTGYTFINEAISENGTEFIVVPTIGIDYEYKLNHRMSLAWVNDFELASYVVEKNDSENLTRSFSIGSPVVFAYEIFPFWGVYAGPGFEFEEHEGFAVAKLGTEFIKEFEGGWNLALSLSVDIKEVNTSPAIGVLVKKAISKPK